MAPSIFFHIFSMIFLIKLFKYESTNHKAQPHIFDTYHFMILAIGGVDCLDLTWLMTCDPYVFTRLFHRSINVSVYRVCK